MNLTFFDAKPYDRPAFEALGEAKGLTLKFYDTRLSPDTVELARGSEAVCVFVNDNVNAEVIDALYDMGVRYLLLRCAGCNNVDVEHAYGKIHIAHVPAYSPYAVAEHAAALLLTSVRRIHKAYNRTREFNFSLAELTGFDLHGKTVGVVGTGKIGRIFINICQGFGMKVVAYDKFPAKDTDIEYLPLEEVLAQSDIVSLHCPLTEETRHLLNRETFARMKKGVVILNTSRGGLIDAEALVEAIKARQVGAACLDVYEEEGDVFFRDTSGHIMDDDVLARLISMPNVIVTSHQAFLTREALENIAETTVDNLLQLAAEGRCGNELCYHCGNVENCRQARKERCF